MTWKLFTDRWRTVVPGVGAILVLTALLVAVPSADERDDATLAATATRDAAPMGEDPSTAAPDVAAPEGSATDGSSGASNATGDTNAASGGPRAIAPVSAATESRDTYVGVSDKEILVGFARQVEGCGGYDANAVNAALGINSDTGKLFEDAVELFNANPQAALELTSEQAAVLGPSGYYGRKVVYKLYDDHGVACQDAGRAMAAKAAEEDGIFAMVQDGSFGTEGWVSEEIAARERIHVGVANMTESEFARRAPYAWDARWPQGDRAMIATASWACRDLHGKAVDSPNDPLIDGDTHVFGLIRFDSPTDEEVANGLKAELSKCGASLAAESAISADPAVSQQQNQTALARMRQAGVTSIFVGVDWVNMTTITQTATKQNYYPYWLISSHYQHDWPSRIYYFFDRQQWRNIMGTTHMYSEHQIEHDSTYEYRMWKLARPESDQPETGWREIVYQVRALFRGIYGAGPNLTAETFGQGLAIFCDPCTRTDPLQPLEILRPGHYSIWADFGIVRWDPTRQDVTEIDGLEGGYRNGFWQFLDDGRRYLGTVRTPSTYVSG